eukprot:1783920-Amphidinium_carterae.1
MNSGALRYNKVVSKLKEGQLVAMSDSSCSRRANTNTLLVLSRSMSTGGTKGITVASVTPVFATRAGTQLKLEKSTMCHNGLQETTIVRAP